MQAACATPSAPMVATAAPTLPSRSDYRDAMARLGAAVSVVTTNGVAGRAGFTASAVCSVTDDPPTLLVCLNHAASVYPAFDANGVLCVNVLGAGQQALSNLFGGKTPMDQRFDAARWLQHRTGSPVLEGAVVSFDCRITGRSRVGTHDVLFCEAVAIAVGPTAHGLVYFNRSYHELLATPSH